MVKKRKGIFVLFLFWNGSKNVSLFSNLHFGPLLKELSNILQLIANKMWKDSNNYQLIGKKLFLSMVVQSSKNKVSTKVTYNEFLNLVKVVALIRLYTQIQKLELIVDGDGFR